MATLAQDESRKTSVRVKYGQQTSMEKGVIYGSGNVLGYDRDGRDYVVNEDQAQTVRLIYDMYAQGKGLKAIKWELERRGIRTAMGNTEWHISSIFRVLKNPLYIGTLTYHRQYTPDFLEQKKVVNHGEIDLLQVKGKHEHLIPDELYQQVQERLEQRRRGWKDTVTESREISTGRKIGDIWTKKLQCECGNRYVRRRWHTRMDGSIEYGYHCYGQVHTGSVRTRNNKGLPVDGICATPVIPDWRLQMMARTIFRYCLQDAGGALKMVEMMLMKHLDDKNSADGDAGRIDGIRREIAGLKRKLDTCVDLLLEGELSREAFPLSAEGEGLIFFFFFFGVPLFTTSISARKKSIRTLLSFTDKTITPTDMLKLPDVYGLHGSVGDNAGYIVFNIQETLTQNEKTEVAADMNRFAPAFTEISIA